MRREGREIARVAGLVAALALALPASAGADTFDVNDDTTGPGPAGADCVTPDFSSIQAAVNFAASGPDGGADDVIRVCAGEYAGAVTVPASADGIDLLGAQAGVDARTRGVPQSEESLVAAAGPGTSGIAVNADRVTIDGFDVEDDDTGQGGISTASTTSGHQLVDNILRGNSTGIRLDSSGVDQTVVRHNLLDSNNDSGTPSGVGIFSANGSSNVLIDENRFTGHQLNSIALGVGTGGSDVTISRNQLVSDNTIAIFRTATATIEDNSVTDSQQHGILLGGGNGDVTLRRNTLTGASGAAVRVRSDAGTNQNVAITSNTIAGNAFGILAGDGAMNGEVEAHFNRIVGNATGAQNDDTDAGELLDAENNWWGCNEGSGQTGCDTVTGNVDVDPWLVLGLTASPTSIPSTGTARVFATFTRNSDNVSVGSGFPDGTYVNFSTTRGGVTPGAPTAAGTATGLLRGLGQSGDAAVSASLDNEATTTGVVISALPAEAQAEAAQNKCKKKKYRKKHPRKCGKKKGK